MAECEHEQTHRVCDNCGQMLENDVAINDTGLAYPDEIIGSLTTEGQ